jgi:hypothetical protein
VDFGSCQVFGIGNDLEQSDVSNVIRPILVQPVLSSSLTNKKLLHIEFEVNPLDRTSDYRVHVVSQSLEIQYDAVGVFDVS